MSLNGWDPDPSDEPDGWLRLEAAVLGASLLMAYGFGLYLLMR